MLNNLVVAITGGAGVIGSQFSKAIVKNKGKVIIGDNDETRSEKSKDYNSSIWSNRFIF